LLICLFAPELPAQDQPPRTEPGPVLNDLVVDGSSVFTSDDVLWLLRLHPGERLSDTPEQLADRLKRRYEREGYPDVHVSAVFDAATGRLTLKVEEPRIDDIEVFGLSSDLADRFRQDLIDRIRIGDVYNSRAVASVVRQLISRTEGALRIGGRGSGPEDIQLTERGGRRVLVVPLRRERTTLDWTTGTDSREDLFNPVDGFSPGFGFKATAFDGQAFNYTFVEGYVSYKFGREDPGFSFGMERKVSHRAGLFVGAEVHDVTATDDAWRVSPSEQTLVSIAFKNTFRDYYRRKGFQTFVTVRPTKMHEFVVSSRWDTHESLENSTNFSFFRDDQIFRPNQPISGGDLRSIVLAYTFDSRGLTDAGIAAGYERHLADDLFRGTRWQEYGARIDWTSEIAGHTSGGDYTFDRHILNARAYIPLSRRQSIAGRAILGFSGGILPAERRFAIGGIGSVHGYSFKETVGEGLTLLNAEYRLDIFGRWSHDDASVLRGVAFLDAGRVRHPVAGSSTDWLKGVGAGLQIGPVRVEFGFRLDDVPKSKQVLVRLSPSF